MEKKYKIISAICNQELKINFALSFFNVARLETEKGSNIVKLTVKYKKNTLKAAKFEILDAPNIFINENSINLLKRGKKLSKTGNIYVELGQRLQTF